MPDNVIVNGSQAIVITDRGQSSVQYSSTNVGNKTTEVLFSGHKEHNFNTEQRTRRLVQDQVFNYGSLSASTSPSASDVEESAIKDYQGNEKDNLGHDEPGHYIRMLKPGVKKITGSATLKPYEELSSSDS